MEKSQALEFLASYQESGGDLNDLLMSAQTLAANSKTPLGLNKWIPTDKPTMADFNEDNRIIDEKLRQLAEEKATRDAIKETTLTITAQGIKPGASGAAAACVYYKDQYSRVTIELNLVPDGVPSFGNGDNLVIAKLPTNYRPKVGKVAIAYANNAPGIAIPANIYVSTAGNVYVRTNGATTFYGNLSYISIQ